MHAARVAILAGTHVDPSKLTVSDHLDEWLERVRPQLSASTHNSYRIARDRISRHIGSLRLQDLRPSHVEKLKSALAADGLAPKTVRNTLHTLRKSLSDAERLELISKNPARVVEAPPVPRANYAVWSPEEIAQYLGHIADTWLYTPIAISALTGMRRGEVIGLRWSDVDFKRGTLTVEQSITSVRGQIVIGKPKTESSRRVLTVGPGLAAVTQPSQGVFQATTLPPGLSIVTTSATAAEIVGTPTQEGQFPPFYIAASDNGAADVYSSSSIIITVAAAPANPAANPPDNAAVIGLAPLTTEPTPPATPPTPSTTVPAPGVPETSPSTVPAPAGVGDSALITPERQEQLTSSAGDAKVLVGGELVEVSVTQASAELRASDPSQRTAPKSSNCRAWPRRCSSS